MAHVKQVHAEKISVPPGTPGLGTVTSIGTALPITGGTITDTGTIGFNNWPADAPGILENDGAGALSWNAQVGQFVHLQGSTPGTPDSGNFHVDGTGVIATQLRVGPPIAGVFVATILVPTTGQAPSDDVIRVLKPDDSDGFIVYADSSAEINVDSTSDGLTINAGATAGYGINILSSSTASSGILSEVTTNVTAVEAIADGSGAGVDGLSDSGIGIWGHSTSGTGVAGNSASGSAGFFLSTDAANTQPTVLISQQGIGLANLLEAQLDDTTKILTFNPNGARFGLGDNPNPPDTMLHLYSGNTFTGNASIIVQNDSQTDGSQITKLCFADTNTATTLSNACIVFETVAGANGDLVFTNSGSDNDTPGPEFFRLVAGDGTVRFGTAGYGFVGIGKTGTFSELLYIGPDGGDGTLTLEASGDNFVKLDSGNPSITLTSNSVDALIDFNSSESDALVFQANGKECLILNGSTGDVFLNSGGGDAYTYGKLSVGSASEGTHTLDVTGDAFITGAFDAKGGSLNVDGTTGIVDVAVELDTVDLLATGVVNFSNLPAIAGAPGTLYADPVTHIVKVSV